jgi:putative FmdB family regulatory protein
MPIYEYKCNGCGNNFEKLVSASSQTDVMCEKCGSSQVDKLMSVVGGIQMGGGKDANCPAAPACGATGSDCSSGSCPMQG